MNNHEISPEEVKRKRDAGESFIILDVREPMEYQTAHISDSVLIPLGELPARIEELDPNGPIVTMCHHGIRSQAALGILLKHGFTDVRNLTGGIDAYSQTADPDIPRYR
ncbi:MAG: rhodanese-like domain-containing protein [Nitrospiria bacterium]